MTELNDLNRKIREALDLHPDLRTRTLKLAQAHYAGELTTSVLDGLMDLLLANRVARPTTRRLTPRLFVPLVKLLARLTDCPERHYIHISEFTDLRATDISLLRFWGLVERHPDQRGYWTLTRMFFYWADGFIKIPGELIFNGGGARVKYQPGPEMVSIGEVLDEDGWCGIRWDQFRDRIRAWMRGGVNRLHLHSRDWCGGAEAYNRNLPDIQQLLEAGADIVLRQNEATSRPAET